MEGQLQKVEQSLYNKLIMTNSKMEKQSKMESKMEKQSLYNKTTSKMEDRHQTSRITRK